MKKSTYTKILLMGGLAMASAAQAQFNSYNPNDLFLVFRKAGSSDLAVNIGSYTKYNKNDGGIVPITQYSSAQINTYANLNSVYWGVFGSQLGGTIVWGTDARSDINTVASPFDRRSGGGLSVLAGQIKGVQDGVKNYGSTSAADGLLNTATAVLIPSADSSSVTTYVNGTANGQLDFNGGMKVGGSATPVENQTGAAFSTGGASKSDLFQMASGSGPGTQLGTFSFSPDGSMQFQAVPEPGTYALFGLGTLGIYLFRRSRK